MKEALFVRLMTVISNCIFVRPFSPRDPDKNEELFAQFHFLVHHPSSQKRMSSVFFLSKIRLQASSEIGSYTDDEIITIIDSSACFIGILYAFM